MNFDLSNTPMNQSLAATVHKRIGSEAKYVAAKSAFWRYLGLGTFMVLLGGGVGLALFGYSFINDTREAKKFAAALAEGLSNATIKLDVGDKSLPLNTENATVKLDSENATVKLDSENATVKLDTSGARVRLDANDSDLPRPTPQQLAPDAKPPSQAKTVTNYTIFKTVEIPGGDIVTGWVFNSSEDATPNHQFCYYTVKTGAQTSNRYNIAVDGKKLPLTGDFPIDESKALANCVWYSH